MYLYPKWLRAWHLINAILFIILIITGLSMQYTDKESTTYMVGFAKAVKWHNYAAFILTANYVIFILGNAFTSNGKHYQIRKEKFWSNLKIQARYYAFGMFKGEKRPFPVTMDNKFNPLQKISYIFAMYIGMPLVIISGFVMLFPEVAADKIFGISGLLLNDILHIASGFLLSVFMIIHIYTCTLGSKPSSLFWGIITGYHRSEE